MNVCSDDWVQNKQYYIKETDICTESCSKNEDYQVIYNFKCVSECPNNTNISIINKEQVCVKDCDNDLSFSKFYLCIENCNTKNFFNALCVISIENIEAKEFIVNAIYIWNFK